MCFIDDISKLNGHEWSKRILNSVVGDYEISTVQLPASFAAWKGDDLAEFETKVFGPGGHAHDECRYSSIEDACMGHEAIVEMIAQEVGDQ